MAAMVPKNINGAISLITETQTFSFERSTDWELIKSIATHRRVYPHISDDFSPKAEDWNPVQDERVWYVIVREDEEVLGMFALFPQSKICWEVHTCMLPKAYGEKGRAATKEAIKWLFEVSACLRIVTQVPHYNVIALRYAIDAGMKEYGYNPSSYMKDGVLQGITLLGISKCR